MRRLSRFLTFVETAVFTKRVVALGLEEPLRQLQEELVCHPDSGVLDPGTGGLRKIRMADPGRGIGKRGGARVHYLWLEHAERIYLLYIYAKSESATLDAERKRHLRELVVQIKAASGEDPSRSLCCARDDGNELER